jgi:hypothetical protein
MFFRKYGSQAQDPVQQAVPLHSKSTDVVNHDFISILTSETFAGDLEHGVPSAVSYAQQRLPVLLLIGTGDFSSLGESLFAQRAKLFESPPVATELAIAALRIVTGRSLVERQRSVMVSLGAVWGPQVAPGMRPVGPSSRSPAPSPVDMLVADSLSAVRAVARRLVSSASEVAAGKATELPAAQHCLLTLESVVAAIGTTSAIFAQLTPAGSFRNSDGGGADDEGEALAPYMDGAGGLAEGPTAGAYKEAIEIAVGAFLDVAHLAETTIQHGTAASSSSSSSVLDELATSFPVLVACQPLVSFMAVKLVLPGGKYEGYAEQFCRLLVAGLGQDVFAVAPTGSARGLALDLSLALLGTSYDLASAFLDSVFGWTGSTAKADLLDVICSDRSKGWAKHLAEYVSRSVRRGGSGGGKIVALLHADFISMPASAVRRTNDRCAGIFLMRLLCSLNVSLLEALQRPCVATAARDDDQGQLRDILAKALCLLLDPFMRELSTLLWAAGPLRLNSITINNLCAMLKDFNVLFLVMLETIQHGAAVHAAAQSCSPPPPSSPCVPDELRRLAARWLPVVVLQTLRLPQLCEQWGSSAVPPPPESVRGFDAVLRSAVTAAEDRHASFSSSVGEEDAGLVPSLSSLNSTSLFDVENQLLLLEGQKGSTPTPESSAAATPVSPMPGNSREGSGRRSVGRVHRQHSFDLTDVWKLDVDEVKGVEASPHRRHHHGRTGSGDVIGEILGMQPPPASSDRRALSVDLFAEVLTAARDSAAEPAEPRQSAQQQLSLFEELGGVPPRSSATSALPAKPPSVDLFSSQPSQPLLDFVSSGSSRSASTHVDPVPVSSGAPTGTSAPVDLFTLFAPSEQQLHPKPSALPPSNLDKSTVGEGREVQTQLQRQQQVPGDAAAPDIDEFFSFLAAPSSGPALAGNGPVLQTQSARKPEGVGAVPNQASNERMPCPQQSLSLFELFPEKT